MNRVSMLAVVVACSIVSAFVALAMQGAPAVAQPQTPKPRFVLNLTSGLDDLHRTTMALELARHALDDGREVLVFLNVKAPPIAARDAAKDSMPGMASPTELLQELIERGASVHVCPMCMKAMRVETDALIPGAVVTDRDKLFSKLESGVTVFSY